jgi:hypothetical protein
MKPYITNGTICYEGKYLQDFIAENLNSYILLTNNTTLKISPGDRRFVMLDVSDDLVGNYDYFDKLGEIIDGPESNLNGEAFYWYCIEYYEQYLKENNGKHFNPQRDRPVTKEKNETIIKHLHSLYVFIKKEFLLRRQGICKQTLANFTNDYKQTLLDDLKTKKDNKVNKYKKHDTEIDTREISRLLKNLGIITVRGSGNKVMVPETPYEVLLELFKKKHWIDEYDDHFNNNNDSVKINNVTINNITVSENTNSNINIINDQSRLIKEVNNLIENEDDINQFPEPDNDDEAFLIDTENEDDINQFPEPDNDDECFLIDTENEYDFDCISDEYEVSESIDEKFIDKSVDTLLSLFDSPKPKKKK